MPRRLLSPLVACAVLFGTARLYADAGAPAVKNGTFDSNGVKIHYTVEGKGEPVLLIHGFSASADLNFRMPGVIKALAGNYQVIAIDNRGHGQSEKPHDPAKYGEEMAEDAVRLLDHLGIKKAHVVGYSMGGMITAKLLTTHPDRLLTATLGGHGGLKAGDNTAVLEKLADDLDSGKGMGALLVALTPAGQKPPTQEAIDAANKRILSLNDPKALAAVVRSWKGLMVSDAKLRENKVPTLALIGETDPLKKGVDALEGKLPNLKVVVIKGADHMTAFARPEFVKELKDFLAAHGANSNGSAKSVSPNVHPKIKNAPRPVSGTAVD